MKNAKQPNHFTSHFLMKVLAGTVTSTVVGTLAIALASSPAMAEKVGNGGGDDIEQAGYVAKYMSYHAQATRWLNRFNADGSLAEKLSVDAATATLIMKEFAAGSDPSVTVEFLSRGHKVNEKVLGLADDRICGNIPTEKRIVCSIDQWDKAEKGVGKGDYSYGSAIFVALDIHERLGVAGVLEQNQGPVSQYPFSSQILKFRHPDIREVTDYEFTDRPATDEELHKPVEVASDLNGTWAVASVYCKDESGRHFGTKDLRELQDQFKYQITLSIANGSATISETDVDGVMLLVGYLERKNSLLEFKTESVKLMDAHPADTQMQLQMSPDRSFNIHKDGKTLETSDMAPACPDYIVYKTLKRI